MPNPKDTENERTDVPAGVHENGHTKTDSNSNMKKGDTTMTEPKKTPGGTGEGVKKKHDPKDPLRPRRKKARRACYACQRAHLTCGKIISTPCLSLPSHSSQPHNHHPCALEVSSFHAISSGLPRVLSRILCGRKVTLVQT